jgi:hypothetical protein
MSNRTSDEVKTPHLHELITSILFAACTVWFRGRTSIQVAGGCTARRPIGRNEATSQIGDVPVLANCSLSTLTMIVLGRRNFSVILTFPKKNQDIARMVSSENVRLTL